jgi:nucleotide-binding universal stress UspA family protein
LLPTDFSKNALNAIEYAFDLYENKTCLFYILNALQDEEYSVGNMMMQPESGSPDYEAAKKASIEGLNELMNLLSKRKKNSKHSCQTLSVYNSLPYAVKETIAKKDIDIVIMGTQGATAAEALLFGTNTMDVMAYVMETPILAIPSGFKFLRPKEIVFPTDFEVVFKRSELAPMVEIERHTGQW